MSRRSAMMAGGRVPVTYQEVEYLQGCRGGSVTQGPAISTLYYPNSSSDYKITLKYQFTETISSYETLLGSHVNEWMLRRNGNSNTLTAIVEDAALTNLVNKANTDIYTIDLSVINNICKIYINNDLYYDNEISREEFYEPLYLFSSHNDAGPVYTANAKIYFVNIEYSSPSRKMSLIPCYRRSDSKPGMYDTVSGTFFVNQGTGEFICGPAVD